MEKLPCYCEDPETGKYITIHYDSSKLFGERLKRLRKKKGLSIKEFARCIGWHYWCIENWESGEVLVGISTLREIAHFLG